ncbi:Beta-lactamase [Leptospira interrogans]|nr:Beta-lactamase [Leptospira interrogans]
MANGKGSQFVYVIPHRRMVIVVTSAIWDKPINFLLDKILENVKEALDSKDKKKNSGKRNSVFRRNTRSVSHNREFGSLEGFR